MAVKIHRSDIKVRRTWTRKPTTKVKPSKKIYRRSAEKAFVRAVRNEVKAMREHQDAMEKFFKERS